MGLPVVRAGNFSESDDNYVTVFDVLAHCRHPENLIVIRYCEKRMDRFLINMAIIKVNWNRSRSDLLDNYIPLVHEAALLHKSKNI